MKPRRRGEGPAVIRVRSLWPLTGLLMFLVALDTVLVVLSAVAGDWTAVVGHASALLAAGVGLVAVGQWALWRQAATSSSPPPIGLN